jgi:hypothetical protein
MSEYNFKDNQRVAVAWVGLENKLKLGIGHIDNSYSYDSTKIRSVSHDGNNKNHIFATERYNEIIPIQNDKDIVFAWRDDDGKIFLKSGKITFEYGHVFEIDHRERIHKINDCDEYFLSYGFKTKKNITQKEVKIIKLKDDIIPDKDDSPKYKIGDRVRCKVHDKEFVIKNVQSPHPVTYYDSDYSSRGSLHKSCNGQRHGNFDGVLEDDLELVEDNKYTCDTCEYENAAFCLDCDIDDKSKGWTPKDENKSEYNFKKGDIIAVYKGDEIRVGEYEEETKHHICIKSSIIKYSESFPKAIYEFAKVPDDTDIVYTCKDIGNNIKFGCGKIIKEDDDSISLDSHKEIFKKSGNIYFVRMKDLFKKENAPYGKSSVWKCFEDLQYEKYLQEINHAMLYPWRKNLISRVDNEKIYLNIDWGELGKDFTVKRFWDIDDETISSEINNSNQEEKTMNTNFSICGFFDEILTGLDPLTKTLKRKKIKQQLESNQDEINRRINSEFWEDGVTPNKKRILKINAEIVQEIKTGQKNSA